MDYAQILSHDAAVPEDEYSSAKADQLATAAAEWDAALAWRRVGQLLGEARRSLRPKVSKREAARRAGFSEITWRQLEAGERQLTKGVKVPPSPKDETLEAAARAVGLDPGIVFSEVGRRYEPPAMAIVRRSDGISVEIRAEESNATTAALAVSALEDDPVAAVTLVQRVGRLETQMEEVLQELRSLSDRLQDAGESQP